MCVMDIPSNAINLLSTPVFVGSAKSVPNASQWIKRTTLSLGPAMIPLRIEWLLVGPFAGMTLAPSPRS